MQPIHKEYTSGQLAVLGLHNQDRELLVELRYWSNQLVQLLRLKDAYGEGGIGCVRPGRGVIPYEEAVLEAVGKVNDINYEATKHLYEVERFKDPPY